jgi:hypothetical protein
MSDREFRSRRQSSPTRDVWRRRRSALPIEHTKEAREQFAYEVLLNKFDVMLKHARTRHSLPNRGLVIHDRRVVVERDIQEWTSGWRRTAGNIGQLRNLADVLLFADSRASRLLQMADLVAYSLHRHYWPDVVSDSGFAAIYETFHRSDGALHGCVHYTPSFGAGSCECDPCTHRLKVDAEQRADPAPAPTKTRRKRKRTRAHRPIDIETEDSL